MLASLPAVAQQQAIDVVVATVEEQIDLLGGDTIVVLPFPYADGVPSVEGTLFSDRVETALAECGRVRIVDRSLLESVMKEQRLSASGLVDPNTQVRVGHLLAAKGLLSGSITDLGDNIEVHIRLTNVETAETVITKQLTTRKTIKTFTSPLWSRIERMKKETEGYSIEMWVGDSSSETAIPGFRIGDFVNINFRVARDCYLTIFDFTTSGSIHVLFPNEFMPDNHVNAGSVYTFPSEQDGFKIRVKGPPGIERLKAFGTTKDVPLFEYDYSQESFRSVTQDNYNVIRDLETVLQSLEANRWGEATLEFCIERSLRGTTPSSARTQE